MPVYGGINQILVAPTTTTVEVTGTSQQASVATKYITNNTSLVTITLPTSANVGDQVLVRGKGAGGWKVAQNAGQTIYGAATTTFGATGYVASQTRRDTVSLECTTANADWLIIGSRGTLTIN